MYDRLERRAERFRGLLDGHGPDASEYSGRLYPEYSQPSEHLDSPEDNVGVERSHSAIHWSCTTAAEVVVE